MYIFNVYKTFLVHERSFILYDCKDVFLVSNVIIIGDKLIIFQNNDNNSLLQSCRNHTVTERFKTDAVVRALVRNMFNTKYSSISHVKITSKSRQNHVY